MREAEVKLEQIQLDQESLEEVQEENVVIREEERLCQEEEQLQDQEEEERAEQEVGSGGADHLLFPGLVAELGLGAALQELSSPLLLTLLGVEPPQACFHGITGGWCHSCLCAFLGSLQAASALLQGWCVCGGLVVSLQYLEGKCYHFSCGFVGSEELFRKIQI